MAPILNNDDIFGRTYNNLKELIISGSYAPGEKLDIERLAEKLRVSTTPIREILNRLVAENLIVMIPRLGFFMKDLSESDIRDLYEINKLLLDFSLDIPPNTIMESGRGCLPNFRRIMDKLSQPNIVSHEFIVNSYSKFFVLLASLSDNNEIIGRIQNINDRLNHIRLYESQHLIDNPAAELLNLFQWYDNLQLDRLHQGLDGYHTVRLNRLVKLIRGMRLKQRPLNDEELANDSV